VEDGHEDAISKAELPAPGKPQIDSRPQLIPKILHQTYINTSIPEVWQGAQQSCLDLHTAPDWEYKLWTDEASLQFIKDEYEWFYETFKNYPYPIQRADAIRYFVLNHYGGVYIDLDDGCNRELEPLLSYPAWVRKTMPTGISNDAMGAVPHHPFFMSVIEKLKDYDRNWILPYITVMGSTGPLFLSVMWRHWVSSGNNIDGGRVRIIFPEEYNGHSWSFFTHHLGNSWHAADVQLIFWVSLILMKLLMYHFTDLFFFRWRATGSSSPSSASSLVDLSSCSAGGPTAATSSCPNPRPPTSLPGKARRFAHGCRSGAVPARKRSTSWFQGMRCSFLSRSASSFISCLESKE
jgi:mannosyltransferase OCH1-like enzyme